MATRYVPLIGVTPNVSTNEDILSIPEARNRIKAKFATYHKLLDDRESKLLAELEMLEETNKPELNHVRSDLVRLRGAVDSLDMSLGTQSLKQFHDEQKNVCKERIVHFERSERLLSFVTLKFSGNFVEDLIQVVPFWSKAKFRTQLQPLLKVGRKLGEDCYVVCNTWYSEFSNSINLRYPQQNDSLEFPVKIPIQTSGDSVNILHSKTWDMLLSFNGLSPDSIPIKRQSYLDKTTNKIEVPKQTAKHKCTIGHNSGYNKFSFECEIETFPYETYEDILKKLSGFYALFTKHPPILYTFDETNTISCNSPEYTQYTVRRPYYSYYRKSEPFQDTKSSVGNCNKLLLVIIPDSTGTNCFDIAEV